MLRGKGTHRPSTCLYDQTKDSSQFQVRSLHPFTCPCDTIFSKNEDSCIKNATKYRYPFTMCCKH